MKININQAKSVSKKLKINWLKTLTSPQDGMWETFRSFATHWEVNLENKTIGYARVNDNNQLIQFYISPKYLPKSEDIFKAFIEKTKIKTAIVGTNNPIYFSVISNFIKTMDVHTHLFREHIEVNIPKKEGILKRCTPKDIDRIIDFCHYSIGASKEWLTGYIGDLIKKEEIFSFENNDEIIGTCEVRKSKTEPKVADIGMIVSPDYRRQGCGTFLLHQAKLKALELGRMPICSCEKGNIGSFKSITNCGFVSRYQLLLVNFE